MENNLQNANINITVDASQAQQAVKQLSEEVQKLSTVMGKLTQQQISLASFSTSIEAVAKQLRVLNLANTIANQQMNAAAGSYDAARKRLKDLDEQIKAAAGGLTSMSPAVKQMVGEYNKLEAQVRSFDEQMGNSGKAFDDFKSNLDALIDTVPEFADGFGAGLTAVGEQLPDLIEGYKSFRAENAALAAQGQPTKSILSQLAGSFGSWNFAITAGMTLLTAYGPQMWEFVKNLFKGKEAVDDTKESTELLNKALESTDYTNAVENVSRLTIDIDLAKNGILKKEEVLKQYNDTIGKVTGQVNDLNEAEKSLTKNSEPYIQMMLHKATATLALQEAAKIAYQAEQVKLKSDEDTLGTLDSYLLSGTKGKGKLDLYHQKAESIRKEEYEKLKEKSNKYLRIARTQETEAGEDNKKIRQGDKPKKEGKSNTGETNGNNQSKARGTNKTKKQQIDEDKQAVTQAEDILKTSQAQELLITTDGYAQQMMAAEKHFKEELEKLKSWYANKLITKDKYEKAAFQLLNERQAATKNAIDTFNKEDKEKTLAASNELIELQIAAMAEGVEKQIDEINHQTELKTQALDKQKEELSEAISKGDASVKALLDSGDETAAAVEQTHLDSLKAQLKLLEDKRKLLVAAGGKALDDVRKAQEDQKKAAKNKAIADNDEAEVNSTNKPGQAAEHFKALMIQLEHRKQAELENTKLTEEEKKKIVDKYKLDKAALEKTEHDRKLNEAIQTEEKIRSAAMNLLGGALKQASEARLRQLNQDKTLELSNTSLTKSQKKAIEDKYKKLELQEKQRAFKQEQKMQIANAVMAGAVAVVKDLGSPWKIAFDIAMTAAQVATILKQKAPAYATGGLHYASDGRGALLSGPGSGTSDSMNARLSNGEAVINARSTGMFGDLLSAINVAGGGRPFGSYWGNAFAAGGTMGNTYLPTRNNPARLNTPLLASPMIDYDMLAASMTRVNLVLDVKDVNREQANLARAVNGSSH